MHHPIVHFNWSKKKTIVSWWSCLFIITIFGAGLDGLDLNIWTFEHNAFIATIWFIEKQYININKKGPTMAGYLFWLGWGLFADLFFCVRCCSCCFRLPTTRCLSMSQALISSPSSCSNAHRTIEWQGLAATNFYRFVFWTHYFDKILV